MAAVLTWGDNFRQARCGGCAGESDGNGMQNLQQRLADVGGKCSIRSQPGQGTTVTLTVPLAAARHQNKRK